MLVTFSEIILRTFYYPPLDLYIYLIQFPGISTLQMSFKSSAKIIRLQCANMCKVIITCYMRRVDSLEKTLMLGGIEGRRRRRVTEDEMAGRHHWLDGHGFGWTPGVGDRHGGLACWGSWGRKESDTTERLNWTELRFEFLFLFYFILFLNFT